MSDSVRVRSSAFLPNVRSQTFRPREDLDMLFVAVDIEHGAVMKAWLVPSLEFVQAVGTPSRRGLLRFRASMKPGTKDRWSSHCLEAEEIAPAVLARLSQLEASRG